MFRLKLVPIRLVLPNSTESTNVVVINTISGINTIIAPFFFDFNGKTVRIFSIIGVSGPTLLAITGIIGFLSFG